VLLASLKWWRSQCDQTNEAIAIVERTIIGRLRSSKKKRPARIIRGTRLAKLIAWISQSPSFFRALK